MTWRLAIDRWRSDRRRTAREQHIEMAEVPTTEDVALSRERCGAALARDRCAAGQAADRRRAGRDPGARHSRDGAVAGFARGHGEVPVVSGPQRAGGESAMSRTERMTEFDERVVAAAEADLDRLLSIEPSPEFAAKVRARIAAEPPPRSGMGVDCLCQWPQRPRWSSCWRCRTIGVIAVLNSHSRLRDRTISILAAEKLKDAPAVVPIAQATVSKPPIRRAHRDTAARNPKSSSIRR